MIGRLLMGRCRICGSKEGLKACVVCGRKACQLHIAGGKCYRCIDKEPFTVQDNSGVAVRPLQEEQKGLAPTLNTELRVNADHLQLLEDLYLLLGGRPGSRRSTTLLGSLHLDQVRRVLMFDRQIARRISSASFVRFITPVLAQVQTRGPSHLVDGSADKDVLVTLDLTTRLAHDQLIRAIDLVSLSLSGQRIQLVAGDQLLDEFSIGQEMACPQCGNWRGICQCPRKIQGHILAVDYFKIAMASRLKQRRRALGMSRDPKNQDLEARVLRWQRALGSY